MKSEEARLTVHNNTLPVILASSSPRRRELLISAGLNPRIVPSDADETMDPSLTPDQLVMQLAERKAEPVAGRLRMAGEEAGLVIGADTVVVIGGETLGKPKDAGDAASMLGKLQGKEHQVYTGVCLIDLAGSRRKTAWRKTDVLMKPLSRERILQYVATGEPMDKAGAYAIQGRGAALVESIRGCYFNVVGLPISLLDDMLADFGVEILSCS